MLVSKIGGGANVKIPSMVTLAVIWRLVSRLCIRSEGEPVVIFNCPTEMLDSLIDILHEITAPSRTVNFFDIWFHNLSYQTQFLAVAVGAKVNWTTIMLCALGTILVGHQFRLKLADIKLALLQARRVIELFHQVGVNRLTVLLFDYLIEVLNVGIRFYFSAVRMY